MQRFDPAVCPVGEVPEQPYFFPGDAHGPDPFASDIWAAHSRALAERVKRPPRVSLRGLARRWRHGHAALGSEHVTLHRLLKARPGRVLDVGGGCGENYAALSRALRRPLDYTVVENERNCALGRAAFPGARFATEIPGEHFDIAAVIGTLQYIPDWRGFLESLKARCDHIVLERTPLRLDGPSLPVLQAVCPQLGAYAGRKAGTARLTIIGLAELREAMSDWDVIEDRHVTDYSGHLTRLPESQRNAAYRSMVWSRRT